MNNNYLLLTLGHNSSALFVDMTDGNVIGYEQERISGIKSDSQFPMDAINEIRKHISPKQLQDCKIRISHWLDSDDIKKVTINGEVRQFIEPNKYITAHDISVLESISQDILFTNKDFTHHDAHAYSALNFFDYHNNSEVTDQHVLVVDGFGTDGEVLSLYSKTRDNTLFLLKRTYGYEYSLGLMYQYATSFCGMKENQDEYKFLGYEAHIDEFMDPTEIDVIDHMIERNVAIMFKSKNATKQKFSVYNLNTIKKMWYSRFREVVYESVYINAYNRLKTTEKKVFFERTVIAYFIQQTVEIFMSMLVAEYNINNLIVAGGLFYNVKVNNHLLKRIKGKFCAMPLAGDQGAAIGMFAHESKCQFPFRDLCFGKRSFYGAEKLVNNHVNIKYIELNSYQYNAEGGYTKSIVEEIVNKIINGRIVNLIYSSMEFGPRALGHTSSIFLPSTDNVADNNHMNNRNEVMPCAPICTLENAEKLFDKDELARVVGSDSYMICTHDYTEKYSDLVGGVMHKKTLFDDTFTGRPQIVNKKSCSGLLYEILQEVYRVSGAKCLVNTSFNVHGRPIAFSLTDILQNNAYQCEHARKDKEPILYIINDYNF